MANSYAQAIKKGAMSASRLHVQLGSKENIGPGGNVDIFSTIVDMDVPLIFRPLGGLLGAYLSQPTPGILVTTERPLSIQRFTAAHELGHFCLKHSPSLDDESVLRRMRNPGPSSDLQEVEADSFATGFILPRWLISWHCERQSWNASDLKQAPVVYQLSLRLGASYEATTWTLQRYNIISPAIGNHLRTIQPKTIKKSLLEEYEPPDYWGDVWILTERDFDLQITGSQNDLFVFRLKEHSGSGYIWNIDDIEEHGFSVVSDKCFAIDEEDIGGSVTRSITAKCRTDQIGQISLTEERPWQSNSLLTLLELTYDLHGSEKAGWSRAERYRDLRAA